MTIGLIPTNNAKSALWADVQARPASMSLSEIKGHAAHPAATVDISQAARAKAVQSAGEPKSDNR